MCALERKRAKPNFTATDSVISLIVSDWACILKNNPCKDSRANITILLKQQSSKEYNSEESEAHLVRWCPAPIYFKNQDWLSFWKDSFLFLENLTFYFKCMFLNVNSIYQFHFMLSMPSPLCLSCTIAGNPYLLTSFKCKSIKIAGWPSPCLSNQLYTELIISLGKMWI